MQTRPDKGTRVGYGRYYNQLSTVNTETTHTYLEALAAGRSDAEVSDIARELAIQQRPMLAELAESFPEAKGVTTLVKPPLSIQPLSSLIEQDLPAVTLILTGTNVSDSELERVAGLLTLVKLYLNMCKSISDDGMRPLTRMPFLEELHLWETRITDEGLTILANAPALRELILYDCLNISPTGVAALATLPTLTDVYLSDSLRFSEKAIEALRRQLPGCEIHWQKEYVWVPKASKM